MHISDLQYIEISTETEVKGGFHFSLQPYDGDRLLSLSLNYEDMLKKSGYKFTYTDS
jgi:hypothetical protein